MKLSNIYIVAFLLSCNAASHAANSDQFENLKKGVAFPDDNGSIVGDHLILSSDAYGFKLPFGTNKKTYCAPDGSRFVVTKDFYVSFYQVGYDLSDKEIAADAARSAQMTAEGIPPGTDASASDKFVGKCEVNFAHVQRDVQYIADEDTQKSMRYERNGFAFGGLIVPFKFRLGKEKKVVSSTTFAPYIGYRYHKFQGYGMDLMPVVSAGLGIVNVRDATKNEDDTKAAFSTAVGFTLSSAKNPHFNAGVLLGKDFLSKKDRAIDPSVNKMWFSLWLGISG